MSPTLRCNQIFVGRIIFLSSLWTFQRISFASNLVPKCWPDSGGSCCGSAWKLHSSRAQRHSHPISLLAIYVLQQWWNFTAYKFYSMSKNSTRNPTNSGLIHTVQSANETPGNSSGPKESTLQTLHSTTLSRLTDDFCAPILALGAQSSTFWRIIQQRPVLCCCRLDTKPKYC